MQKAVAAPSTPLTLVLEEKITAAMNREGGVEPCEVKGTLILTANRTLVLELRKTTNCRAQQ